MIREESIGHGMCCALANVSRLASASPFTRARGRRVAIAVIALVSACATPAQRGRDSASAERPAVEDTARIARLEREARALVNTGGCETAASCRAAPVGPRGCGGPRNYLVYCPATTDTVALLRKLEELRRAEMAYNEREGVVSTCEMRLPPALTVNAGRCVAAR